MNGKQSAVIALIVGALGAFTSSAQSQSLSKSDCRAMEFAEIQTLSDAQLDDLKTSVTLRYIDTLDPRGQTALNARCEAEKERLARIWAKRLEDKKGKEQSK